jgi:PhnB protein
MGVTTTTFQPYLFFSGDCRQAFTRYHEIFGGDLTILSNSDAPDGAGMPGAPAELVMHAAVVLPGGGVLMGSDDPTGDGGPKRGVSVNVSVADEAEAKRVYDALAEGGEAQMPLEPTFFSPAFGSLVDRFGISWLVGATDPGA